MLGDRTQSSTAEMATDQTGPRPRQRAAKGRRPYFLKDPDADRLLAIITALVGEVSVVRERLDTAERLAEQGLLATPENIEAYHPAPAVEAEREAVRGGMLNRVYRILMSERKAEPGDQNYEAVVKQFS